MTRLIAVIAAVALALASADAASKISNASKGGMLKSKAGLLKKK